MHLSVLPWSFLILIGICSSQTSWCHSSKYFIKWAKKDAVSRLDTHHSRLHGPPRTQSPSFWSISWFLRSIRACAILRLYLLLWFIERLWWYFRLTSIRSAKWHSCIRGFRNSRRPRGLRRQTQGQSYHSILRSTMHVGVGSFPISDMNVYPVGDYE